MAYSTLAEARRRCVATRRDGAHCRAWALWNDPQRRCRMHSDRRGHGRAYRRVMTSTLGELVAVVGVPVCRCVAYRWPHRPDGGVCRWPEEPAAICATPLGTRGKRG